MHLGLGYVGDEAPHRPENQKYLYHEIASSSLAPAAILSLTFKTYNFFVPTTTFSIINVSNCELIITDIAYP